MLNARIDISTDLEGEPVVFACVDLDERELAASAHAVSAVAAERFRRSDLSADQVLQLRELTALADELGELTGGAGTVVLRPARLSAFTEAVAGFVQSRDDAEWIREEDREPFALLRAMLDPLERLNAEAVRSALAPTPRPC
jgi:hypothetical protein